MRHLRVWTIALLLCLAGSGLNVLHAQNFGFAPVGGQFIDGRTGQPIPGLTISLIHPQLGRSAPAYTDGLGRFGWQAIPVQPSGYFLEAYWGQRLIFRQAITVRGPVFLPPIRV